MANLLTQIFKAADIQRLLDLNPTKIVVRATLEEATLKDGANAGVVKVYAEAVTEGKVIGTAHGCPDPPCQMHP